MHLIKNAYSLLRMNMKKWKKKLQEMKQIEAQKKKIKIDQKAT